MDDTTNNAGVTGDTSGETPATTPATPASFDEWVAKQPDTVKQLVDGHTTGLRTALNSERDQRKDLAKQLRDATAAAEKGSVTAKTLEEISGRLDAAEKRAVFFETAATPGVGCTNPRAAFLVAQAEGLFKKNGEPDWQALQSVAPELFRKAGQANAGAGTNTPPPAKASMNEFIRRAAGRG